MGTIIALAGRRIDAPGAPVTRFPLANARAVQERLRDLFAEEDAVALVSSAACGADLLALEAAASLGLRLRVVLPFARERFRETSVTDRPGDWGQAYDRVLDSVVEAGELVVLEDVDEDDDGAYAAATHAILDEALRISGQQDVAQQNQRTTDHEIVAVIVWDGRSRGPGDLTAHFSKLAEARNLPVVEVITV